MKSLPIIVLVSIAIPILAGEYVRHSDTERKISYSMPEKWKIAYKNLGNRSYHIMTHKDGSTVTVSVQKGDRDNLEKWNRWNQWYIKGMGNNLYTILNEGTLQEKVPSKKLIVIQYRHGKKKFMERIFITAKSSILAIVNCRAELNDFNRHSDTCDKIMGSVKFLD